MHKPLDHTLLLVLSKSLDVEWMDHAVGISLTFSKMALLFSKVGVPFYTPTGGYGSSSSFRTLLTLGMDGL